uniref:Solute carrier family 35 member E4 n=1 Tax=Anas platyrhynchos platyrhynchos TaxID=8840 RepID=A0A493T9E8_ANAPP
MCPRCPGGDEAAMTAAGGTLQPRRPEPGWQLSGPPLSLALTVLAWLGTGTALAGLNKWIFAAHGFRYPLLLSSLHMLAAVALGYPLGWARGPLPSVRPRARIYLLSLTFCGSVALGNLGLSLVPLDAAQAVHATAPLATLLLSALLRGRRHHPLQYAAMGPVCAGAACSIAGGVHFHQPGGCVLLAATVLRALKSLQQSKCRPRQTHWCPRGGTLASSRDTAGWWQCLWLAQRHTHCSPLSLSPPYGVAGSASPTNPPAEWHRPCALSGIVPTQGPWVLWEQRGHPGRDV